MSENALTEKRRRGNGRYVTVATVREPDPAFADPRLAVHYDFFDGDRSDLDAYEDIVREVGAATVVDIGCGTGSFAVRLAAHGIRVVGLDPARASLDVARSKPHADRVEWLHGDATVLNERSVDADLAVMTGNVAQVFIDDRDWDQTLREVRGCLNTDGWFVFRKPSPGGARLGTVGRTAHDRCASERPNRIGLSDPDRGRTTFGDV